MKTMHNIDGRQCGIETVNRVDLTDTSIWTLRVSWTHGIYHTHEEVMLTLVSVALGEDHVIFADGTIEDAVIEQMSGGPRAELYSALDEHISKTV